MTHTPKDIKRSKKESLLYREVARLLTNIIFDDAKLTGLFVSRVKLSPESGLCHILFYANGGEKEFKEKLEFLKLYKPSLRKAIAHQLQSRYTPEIKFEFDSQFEKEVKMNELLDKLKDEGKWE